MTKSNISYDKYLKNKDKFSEKSYAEKFSLLNNILYSLSWVGNILSILLSVFYIQKLFYSSFSDISENVFVTIIIVVCLIMFELLKRNTFDLFSIETIKNKFNIFKKEMILISLGTLFIVSSSFFLSLSGAREFMDKHKTFELATKSIISSKKDSIINLFETKKNEYITENTKLKKYNDDLRIKLNTATTADINKFQRIVDKNNETIANNNKEVQLLDKSKTDDINSLKDEESGTLESSITENKANIIVFVCISFIVELFILMGILHYDYYNNRINEEYEETIINTPEFKTWFKYNSLLELIYSLCTDIGEVIPIGDRMMELAEVNKINISRPEFEKFVKVLYSLDILIKEGKSRLLNKKEKDGLLLLKNNFKIK